jgi:hypothetical protein
LRNIQFLNGNESVHFYVIDCFFPLLPTRPLPDLTMSNYGVCLIITGLADPSPAPCFTPCLYGIYVVIF